MKKTPQKKISLTNPEGYENVVKDYIEREVQNALERFVQSSYGFRLNELSILKNRMDNMSKDIIEIGQFARTMNSTYENVLKTFIEKK